MRNVLECHEIAPMLAVEAVRGGDVAVFTDADFFGQFSDGGREALQTTLSLVKDQVEEALMTTQVETMPNNSVSEWRMTVDITDEGAVSLRKLFLTDMLAQVRNWESVILMVSAALTVLLAKTVVFV